MEVFYDNKRDEKRKIILMIVATVLVIIAVIAVVVLLFFPHNNSGTVSDETTQEETTAEVETLKLSSSTTAAATTATTAATTQTTTQSSDSSEYSKIFTDTDDYVTAKESTNLRDDYYDSANVVATLTNGEYIERTGYSDYGWSRLIYNGEVVYAKTQLLLAEGETAASVTSWTDEFDMTYEEVNDQVTAKDQTNLRTVPSTDSDSTIYVTLSNGTYVTRIGIGDKGWSKISYDGQILYAVTSYLTN